MLKKIKEFFLVVIDAGKEFSEDQCMKMSAALAYYTIFSIGPLVLIVIWALGFFYGSQLEGDTTAHAEVMDELTGLFGAETATMLEGSAQKLSTNSNSTLSLIIGVGTLMFTSTTIFVDIQNSINTIWKLKPKPKKGWLKMVINRLLSFSMIIGLAFLLMASLILSSMISVVSAHLNELISRFNFLSFLGDGGIDIIDWINLAITFVAITSLFAFIYSALPDAKVRFKDILGGSIFTALLFMLGKYVLSIYLASNATASAYGAAGSLIILLLWVCYSSAILYFGAEFTKVYALKYGRGIVPASYAVVLETTEYEIEESSGKKIKVVQENAK